MPSTPPPATSKRAAPTTLSKPEAKRVALEPRITSQLCEKTEAQLAKIEGVTKAGWALPTAIRHIAQAHEGMSALISKHGIPRFYTEPSSSRCIGPVTFVSLCRTIVGQQLAGAAVRKIWGRLEEQFGAGTPAGCVLTPEAFITRTSDAQASNR